MALTTRLRRALTGSSNLSPTPSNTSSNTSSTTSLSSTSSNSPTAIAAAAAAATFPDSYPATAPLTKTPSRLRLLLTRSRDGKKDGSSKKDKSKRKQPQLHPEWHDYTGPRALYRRTVDPAHRAQLESWSWGACEDGRRNSAASSYFGAGVSPCQSRAASVDLRRETEEES